MTSPGAERGDGNGSRHTTGDANGFDASATGRAPTFGPTVVLDTNVLMAPVETDVRVFEELDRLLEESRWVVPRAAVEELERLADAGGGTEARAASVGRDLVADRCDVVDHAAESADDAVLECAADADFVATSDGPLRDRVLDAGIPVISLRATNKLEITYP